MREQSMPLLDCLRRLYYIQSGWQLLLSGNRGHRGSGAANLFGRLAGMAIGSSTACLTIAGQICFMSYLYDL
jgi:hypothetical protein